jgi:hypothetical protein
MIKYSSLLLFLLFTAHANENYKELPTKQGYLSSISACKVLGSEWRLPEIWELFDLRGKTDEFGMDKRYWSATSLKESRELSTHTGSDEVFIRDNSIPAFAFYLQDGDITPTPKEINALALCTNLPKREQKESYFTLTENGVEDSLNNILWEPQASNNKENFEDAKEFCEEKKTGGKSWRLPSVDELYSIVNYNYVKPSVNTAVFSQMKKKYYWSEDSFRNDEAYVVGFSIGSVATSKKSLKSYFRCVSDKE